MKVKINPTVCLACFVHDLTNWHISCTPSFSRYWSAHPQPLSPKEKTAIKTVAPIFGQYLKKHDELWLRQLWLASHRPAIPSSQLPLFQTFSPRFSYFYHQQFPNMRKVKLHLDHLSSSRPLSATRRFYGYSSPARVSAYLALSHRANREAGGMLIDLAKNHQYSLILKFGDFILGKNNWPLENTFLHELSHVYQCTPEFETLISRYASRLSLPPILKQQGLTSQDILTELIHASLWGQTGYLSRSLYATRLTPSPASNSYLHHIQQAALSLSPIVKDYLKTPRIIDDDFVIAAVNSWQQAVAE